MQLRFQPTFVEVLFSFCAGRLQANSTRSSLQGVDVVLVRDFSLSHLLKDNSTLHCCKTVVVVES